MKLPDLRTPRGAAIAIGAAVLATVLAAFAIPPGVSGGDATTNGAIGLAGDLTPAPPEDLSRFIGSDRWGISLEEVLEDVAAENLSRRGLNPALRRMGFLGLIEVGDATAVLLADPELDGGGIIQLAPGDTLPDGRVLTSVTDNSITLTSNPAGPAATESGADPEPGNAGTSTRQEVLLLFPRGETNPAPGQTSR